MKTADKRLVSVKTLNELMRNYIDVYNAKYDETAQSVNYFRFKDIERKLNELQLENKSYLLSVAKLPKIKQKNDWWAAVVITKENFKELTKQNSSEAA
ncbi:MAG: hypothetical protein J6T22_09290 [Bacteroidales bacterium]|nr:hypothetical protein [Bacteroidales bacterium]MBO7617387.1 hypothetical protein [Bacteroidales bacterium]